MGKSVYACPVNSPTANLDHSILIKFSSLLIDIDKFLATGKREK